MDETDLLKELLWDELQNKEKTQAQIRELTTELRDLKRKNIELSKLNAELSKGITNSLRTIQTEMPPLLMALTSRFSEVEIEQHKRQKLQEFIQKKKAEGTTPSTSE